MVYSSSISSSSSDDQSAGLFGDGARKVELKDSGWVVVVGISIVALGGETSTGLSGVDGRLGASGRETAAGLTEVDGRRRFEGLSRI